jgi:TolB protein
LRVGKRSGAERLRRSTRQDRGRGIVMVVRYAGLALVGAAVAVGLGAPASAGTGGGTAPIPRVAFVRTGSIYLLTGTHVTRVTHDTDDSRPRYSPDGTLVAFGHAGRLWVMNADGTGRHAVATGTVGGADWSPDGTRLAFEAPGCNGLNGVFAVAPTGGKPRPLFPVQCRDVPVPAPAAPVKPTGDLATRLRADVSVAWSPDGTRIAFPGGECLAILDDCLTVGTVATGDEQMVAGYGGGGQIGSGFAVLPAWRPDGKRLAWTGVQKGGPVHVVEADPTGKASRTIGVALDRELSYAGTGYAVVTGQYQGASWLFEINLGTGACTRLAQGSQPSVLGVGGA